MGIPYYFYNIYKKYNIENDLIINENDISKCNIEYLFLDYNSMIHPCAQKTLELLELELNENKNKELYSNEYIENSIIDYCIHYTKYIIHIINPKYIYIMIDGVAPRAKINQQRGRRYKTHFLKLANTKKNENEKYTLTWNSNKITPGTKFMDKLILKLNDFKNEYKNTNTNININNLI